ncbi:ORF 1: putative Polyprotein CP [Bienertia sinuspersici]
MIKSFLLSIVIHSKILIIISNSQLNYPVVKLLKILSILRKMSLELHNKDITELQELFDKEENLDELNKIMTIIAEKRRKTNDEGEQENYTIIEEDLYQQMGLIKLDDLEFVPLEDIKRKLDNKLGKMIVDNNKVGEEINQEETTENNFVNNTVQRPKFQGETSNRVKYIPGKTTRFTCKVMPTQSHKQEEINLEPISQSRYKLNLDGVRNRMEVLEHWKKSMSSVLNLNTEWKSENFLNYIEHSLYGCVADWYEAINEETKTTLRQIELPTAMFRQLCQFIELEFVGYKANPNEKILEYQRKLSNITICNLKFVESYIMGFKMYYYKIGENETNLEMFFHKLPSPIYEEIIEKYQEWKEKYGTGDSLGKRISFLRTWIEKKCREVAGTQQMKK